MLFLFLDLLFKNFHFFYFDYRNFLYTIAFFSQIKR